MIHGLSRGVGIQCVSGPDSPGVPGGSLAVDLCLSLRGPSPRDDTSENPRYPPRGRRRFKSSCPLPVLRLWFPVLLSRGIVSGPLLS